MSAFEKILLSADDDLLSTLEPYQADIITTLLEQSQNNHLQTVNKWLIASQSNILAFGGGRNTIAIFREKLMDEVEKFLCGDEQYKDDRQKIQKSADVPTKYMVGVITTAIASQLGTSGPVIAPAIVVILMSFAKMPLNAWCQMRKQAQQKDRE